MDQPSAACAAALNFILRWEGGFVDDPKDHGGRTNKGITQAVYEKWLRDQGLDVKKDVKDIGDDEVGSIYQACYWLPAHCEDLRAKLDLVQMDAAVNMGLRRAARILQAATGCAVDGAIGQHTLAAAASCDLGTAVSEYCRIREGLYRRFAEAPGQDKFLKGWLNRLNALRREVGLPVKESLEVLTPGPVERIPDLPEGALLEAWH